MADPYGNYQANQGLLSGPGLNPKGLDPELLRQITGILSSPGPAIGLGFPAGYEGAKGPMAAERLGQYAVEGGGLSQDDVIAHSLAASSMMMGGGMPMAESGAVGMAGGRLAGARQLGFDVDMPLYHGRAGNFEGTGFKEGPVFLTPDPSVANFYAGQRSQAEVMPLVSRAKNPKEIDLSGEHYDNVNMPDILKKARDEGHDSAWIRNVRDWSDNGIKLQDQFAVFDPTALRSKFATFNPAYADTANLLASGGNPIGILSDRRR
jgi:hypothetical protein